MSKSIWVIEQGCYSDYGVVGVFSTKENAELVCDKINTTDSWVGKATIAEWTLDPAVADLRAGRTQWSVRMLRDGTVEDVNSEVFSGYEIQGRSWIWDRPNAPGFLGRVPPALAVLCSRVWAKTRDQAVKIVNEQRIQMIANGEWK